MSLRCEIHLTGETTDDLVLGAEEVVQLLAGLLRQPGALEEFTGGGNSNDTGSYRFEVSTVLDPDPPS